MALDDSIREMFAMIELEIRRLRHDRTEIYTRAVQPILWLGVFGTIMGRVNAIPTGGLPYIDYITPGVLLQSTIFVSVFYGLTIVWERETGILKRLLVAPTSIYATVVGRSAASGVRAVVQALIIFPVAMLLGGELLPRPKGRGFPAA
ncbi:ABC transporter permease, partial [Methanothrix soehngenii]